MERILKHMTSPTRNIKSDKTVTKKAIHLLIVQKKQKKDNDDNKSKYSKESKSSIKNLSKDMNKDKKTFNTLQYKIAELIE